MQSPFRRCLQVHIVETDSQELRYKNFLLPATSCLLINRSSCRNVATRNICCKQQNNAFGLFSNFIDNGKSRSRIRLLDLPLQVLAFLQVR